MQLRRLAALERQKIIDELAKIEIEIADLKDILAKPERQRKIVSDELGEIVAKWGDERRTQIIPFDGEVSMEDLIAREDVVVTITRTGYAKRTKVDLYRSQQRGGKGVSGAHAAAGRHRQPLLRLLHARLDPVLHEQGPGLPGQGVRAARGEPDGQGPARGQPARVPAGRAHRPGHPDPELRGRAVPGAGHQERPGEEDASWRSSTPTARGGIIAINLRDDDELVGAALVGAGRRPAAGLQAGAGDPVQRRPTRRCGRWAGPPPA